MKNSPFQHSHTGEANQGMYRTLIRLDVVMSSLSLSCSFVFVGRISACNSFRWASLLSRLTKKIPLKFSGLTEKCKSPLNRRAVHSFFQRRSSCERGSDSTSFSFSVLAGFTSFFKGWQSCRFYKMGVVFFFLKTRFLK